MLKQMWVLENYHANQGVRDEIFGHDRQEDGLAHSSSYSGNNTYIKFYVDDYEGRFPILNKMGKDQGLTEYLVLINW